jgi:hypothetical protein
MKIYAIYDGKVVGHEVRETEKQYISLDGRSGLAFGCHSRFQKDEYATTAVDAIQKEIIRKYNQRDFHLGKCNQLRIDIDNLDGLLEETR